MHTPADDSYSKADDARLCALVCQGNDSAFEEITHRYTGLIRAISEEYSYPGFDSNDFMQLGLMGLYGACKAFSPQKGLSFKNFAAVCIKRRYISLMRSLSKGSTVPNDALVSIEQADVESKYLSAESLVLDKESDRSYFEHIKSKLSTMELLVLKKYCSGMSYAEIAQSTGLDTKAVDNALQRIRKKLIR